LSRDAEQAAGAPSASTAIGDAVSVAGPAAAASQPDLTPWTTPIAIKDPPWSMEDLAAFILFAFLSFIFANVMAVGLFSVLRRRFDWNVSVEQAFTQAPWVVSMQTAWEILWLFFIYFTVSVKYRRRFWEALKWVRAPGNPAAYLAGGAAIALTAQGIFNLLPSHKELPIERLFSDPKSAYLLTFFGVLWAPFVEELVFRGFFYPVFERKWGLWTAVALTALLFAAIHAPQLKGGWEEISSIFIVGVVFSYCRGKTRSLTAPYLMHLAYNAALFVSLYFSTDRFRLLKG
jgi:membrane protease YdiL (CAAX protease family)